MIKTIIADNEVWVCKLIMDLVDWEDLGFSVIGAAHDGLELISMIENEAPDLIITDIQMPGKSGIEVIQYIKEKELPVSTIILSGFNDFEYAKSAIDLGVFSYLLKPLEKDTLTSVLLNFKNAKFSSDNKTQEFSFLQQQLFESQKQYFNMYIKSILKGENSIMTLEEINSHFSRSFKNDIFKVILIAIDPHIPNDNATEKIASDISDFFSDLFSSTCHDMFFLEQQPFCCAIINYAREKDSLVDSLMHDLLFYCTHSIPYVSSNSITIGIGQAVTDIEQINASYDSALNAVHSRAVVGLKNIIRGDNLASTPIVLSNNLKTKIASFVNCYTSKESVAAIVDEVIHQYTPDMPPYAPYQFVKSSLETALSSISDTVFQAYNIQFNLKNDMLDLEKTKSVNDLRGYLTVRLTNIRTQYKSTTGEAADIIDIVKKYIAEHLSEEITLTSLASIVHFNSNYLCELFKKETGENFNKYLTVQRLEKAKQYLSDPTIRSNDVAKMVGYNDVKYFNRLFKQYIGLTPKQYRKVFLKK